MDRNIFRIMCAGFDQGDSFIDAANNYRFTGKKLHHYSRMVIIAIQYLFGTQKISVGVITGFDFFYRKMKMFNW